MNVLLTIQLHLEGGSNAERTAFYKNVMEHLENLDVIEPDFCAEAITVALPQGDLGTQVCHASGTIRTAIHAAGGCTPNWPDCDELEPELHGENHWIVRWVESKQAPRELVDAAADC